MVHLETGRHLYGGALQVAYLLRGLAGGPDQHILICPPGAGVAEAAGDAPAEVHHIPIGGDLDLGLLWRVAGIMQREGADLLHVHSRRGADYWGGLAARAARVPAVLTRRVDNPERPWAARRKYRLYHRVVAISEGIRQVLVAEGVDRARLTVIPSAVDTDLFRPDPAARKRLEKEFAVPPGAPVLAMAAQFIPRKGHDVLLNALPQVLAAYPEARVLLFGQGPLEDHVATRVRAEGLADRVSLWGFRADLDRVLPGVDLVIHPARMEGLGVILLQAAACGVPVVASRVGGIPDAVQHGETGILVAADDATSLAHEIVSVLARPEQLATLGRNARQRAKTVFSIPRMAASYRALYREIAAAPQPQT